MGHRSRDRKGAVNSGQPVSLPLPYGRSSENPSASGTRSLESNAHRARRGNPRRVERRSSVRKVRSGFADRFSDNRQGLAQPWSIRSRRARCSIPFLFHNCQTDIRRQFFIGPVKADSESEYPNDPTAGREKYGTGGARKQRRHHTGRRKSAFRYQGASCSRLTSDLAADDNRGRTGRVRAGIARRCHDDWPSRIRVLLTESAIGAAHERKDRQGQYGRPFNSIEHNKSSRGTSGLVASHP